MRFVPKTSGQMTAAEYRKQVVSEFDLQLQHRLHDHTDLTGLPAPAAAGRSAAATISTRNHFDTHAGPFYDTGTVRQVLNISRQAIADRARRHTILRMLTTDGLTVYPAFQFVDRTVDPRLIPVLQILLSSGESGWTVALWLTAPVDLLEGASPIEALRSGRADQTHLVHQLASDDAARWAA